MAIRLCSETEGCALRIADEKKQSTHDLEAQLRALHLKYPELAKARRAMDAVLRDTDPNLTAVPDRPRAKKDEEGQR